MLKTNDIFKQQLSKDSRLHTLSDAELEKLKQTVLEIADDVIKVLEKHDIPYALGGGTALGAIRHKGFIPWDDDIDINIESRYFKKLYDCLEEELGDKYVLSIPGKTAGFFSTFCEVHKKGTLCREDLHTPDEISGIKIDIFPFVATYDNAFLRALHGIACDGGSFVMSCMRMHMFKDEFLSLAGSNKAAVKAIRIKSALGVVPALFPMKTLRLVMALHNMCRSKTSKYLTCPSGRAHFKGELRQRAGFEKLVDAPFEDKVFKISKDTKSYLKRLYGSDYMTPPPEDKREKHVLYELSFGK